MFFISAQVKVSVYAAGVLTALFLQFTTFRFNIQCFFHGQAPIWRETANLFVDTKYFTCYNLP
jgi:hypothetical protein